MSDYSSKPVLQGQDLISDRSLDFIMEERHWFDTIGPDPNTSELSLSNDISGFWITPLGSKVKRLIAQRQSTGVRLILLCVHTKGDCDKRFSPIA